jgi:hypothetical protein
MPAEMLKAKMKLCVCATKNYAVKVYGGVGMEVSGQPHAPAALSKERDRPVPNG